MGVNEKFPNSIWLIDTGSVQGPIVCSTESNPFRANPAPDAAKYVREALAQQPAAGVELTDDDFVEAVKPLCKSHDIAVQLVRYSRDEYRAVIAAHEAKKNGGVV